MDNFDKDTDEWLWQLAASGDKAAEEKLVRNLGKLVKASARPFFLAGGDSEDLMQEGMLGLISAIREYDPQKRVPFKTYARLCIRRRLLTAIKTANRYKHTPLNDSLSFDSPLFDENQNQAAYIMRLVSKPGPEEQFIAKEGAEEIMSAFSDRLSRFEAEILGLYLEGLSYQEIAAELNKSPKSVDNAVQRIRRKLAQHLNSGDVSQG